MAAAPATTTEEPRVCPPVWVPLATALPIALCMVVLGLPDLEHGHVNAFRALYLGAFLLWCLPLTLLQRLLWRRRTPWPYAAALLLATSYAFSLLNNAAGMAMARGWRRIAVSDWPRLFIGLDGCWLALVAFCALHAVVNYYTVYRAEAERAARALALLRDAELRALRYQLHPHFLFNTLNAISSLVARQHNREASRMIALLADFLRAALERGERHEVALAEELALAESYLEIEKARLGERLALELRIGPDVLDALVPFLLLQPLVENAIRHGIARRREPGRLAIRIERDERWLHVAVDNDGPPSSPAPESPRATPAIGLRNARERLATLYGGQHHLSATPAADGSFAVRIRLPFRRDAALAASAVAPAQAEAGR